MNKKQTLVLQLSRTHLTVGKVSVKKSVSVKEKQEADWTPDNIDSVIQEIKDTYHAESVRIVLDDELSYLLEIEIPAGISEEDTRTYIAGKLTEEVPEKLADTDWDFKKEAFPASNKDKAIVFAPMMNVYSPIRDAIKKAGLSIESVEPAAIAQKRHQDPMIGTTLKRDIKGTDKHILNLPQTKPSRDTKVPIKILAITLGIIAIILAGVSGAYLLRPNNSQPSETDTTPIVPVVETQEESTDPAEPNEPSQEVIVEDYNIQVLNGSGAPGEAGKIQQRLLVRGFEEVTTENASNFNYTDTEVQLNATIPKELFTIIAEELSEYTVIEGAPLADTSPYDAVVIIGAK